LLKAGAGARATSRFDHLGPYTQHDPIAAFCELSERVWRTYNELTAGYIHSDPHSRGRQSRGIERANITYEIAPDLGHWGVEIVGKLKAWAKAIIGPTSPPGKYPQLMNANRPWAAACHLGQVDNPVGRRSFSFCPLKRRFVWRFASIARPSSRCRGGWARADGTREFVNRKEGSSS